MPWVQQRRCLRRTLRESSRERPNGDGAGGGSSEAGRVLVAASRRRSASAAGRRTRVSGRRWLGLTDDWRRMTRAGVELSSAREGILAASFSWLQHGPLSRAGLLDERDAAPTGFEFLGRAGVYVPRFLFPNPPLSIYSLRSLPVLEGTQASTLWRVSSWSPSRSCSFRCVSPSPTTLTPTASLESTFDRLPLGCLNVCCL